MTVLDEILVGVREDLQRRRISRVEMADLVANATPSLNAIDYLNSEAISVIAEVKRSSPSKGNLAAIADPAGLAKIYESNGAAIVSVLTEGRRFGGSLADLDAVRRSVSIPILRKDFMVDEYQFLEARAHGADMVLLIVAALDQVQLADFLALTHELGMKALVEVHTESELDLAMAVSSQIIGVNSRNLKTLAVDINCFAELLPRIPDEVIKVAESGIATRLDVEFAVANGANAVLVGEALVKGSDPGASLRALLGQG